MNEERLPWHKPEVQELAIAFDTRHGTGDLVDLETHDASFADAPPI